jgi:hypothetical protein
MTPLDYAWDRPEIADYLRSKGAKSAKELLPSGPVALPDQEARIRERMESCLGKISPLTCHEIVSETPPIKVHFVDNGLGGAYFTTGMSSLPLHVPEGREAFRHAELIMYLAPDSGLAPVGDTPPTATWPIEWLRRLARYPHENKTWLGAPITIIANGDLPSPIAPGIDFTSFLLGIDSELGTVDLGDGNRVVFYSVNGLYTEERELELREGLPALVRKLDRHKIDLVIRPGRTNTALAP